MRDEEEEKIMNTNWAQRTFIQSSNQFQRQKKKKNKPIHVAHWTIKNKKTNEIRISINVHLKPKHSKSVYRCGYLLEWYDQNINLSVNANQTTNRYFRKIHVRYTRFINIWIKWISIKWISMEFVFITIWCAEDTWISVELTRKFHHRFWSTVINFMVSTFIAIQIAKKKKNIKKHFIFDYMRIKQSFAERLARKYNWWFHPLSCEVLECILVGFMNENRIVQI